VAGGGDTAGGVAGGAAWVESAFFMPVCSLTGFRWPALEQSKQERTTQKRPVSEQKPASYYYIMLFFNCKKLVLQYFFTLRAAW